MTKKMMAIHARNLGCSMSYSGNTKSFHITRRKWLEPTPDYLPSLTVPVLKDMAKALNIPKVNPMKKDDVIEAIKSTLQD